MIMSYYKNLLKRYEEVGVMILPCNWLLNTHLPSNYNHEESMSRDHAGRISDMRYSSHLNTIPDNTENNTYTIE
jgi:hypothetical protein